jgi:phage tail tape-measure protein
MAMSRQLSNFTNSTVHIAMSVMAQAVQDRGSITKLTKEIRSKFAQTTEALISKTDSQEQTTADALNDAFQRFQLWVGNIGAAINTQKNISLESRLKTSPEVREQIFSLLRDLIKGLDDCG